MTRKLLCLSSTIGFFVSLMMAAEPAVAACQTCSADLCISISTSGACSCVESERRCVAWRWYCPDWCSGGFPPAARTPESDTNIAFDVLNTITTSCVSSSANSRDLEARLAQVLKRETLADEMVRTGMTLREIIPDFLLGDGVTTPHGVLIFSDGAGMQFHYMHLESQSGVLLVALTGGRWYTYLDGQPIEHTAQTAACKKALDLAIPTSNMSNLEIRIRRYIECLDATNFFVIPAHARDILGWPISSYNSQ